MKKNVFRSVEFWKSAVMTMPDNSFFELLRSVFGKIKTPFNKQQLLRDLEIFLLREDIQKTISAYIDENDAKIIAAIALFGEPFPGELESFFSDEFSYVELHDKIINLEERFILYRFREKDKLQSNENRLALNPVLDRILLPFVSDISPLFPVVAKSDDASLSNTAKSPMPESPSAVNSKEILNDRILAGLLSFVSQWDSPPLAKTVRRLPAFFKPEGIISKYAIESGKTIFPFLNLEEILGSLQLLGLFFADGDKLIPDRKRFYSFAASSEASGSNSARERMEYCAAALLVYKEVNTHISDQQQNKRIVPDFLPPLYKPRIREISNFIHSFLDSLNTDFFYGEKTLNRLAEILKAKTGTTVNSNILFEALEKTGLLTKVMRQKDKYAQVFQLGSIVLNKAIEQDKPSVAIDSGFSVLVYPEISYTDVIDLAAFLNIKEAGAVVRFELEKDSAVRAFNNKISADKIIDLLNRLSGNRVDETFIWNLREWEKRHGEVSLKKGVVLTLAEDKRFLTQTIPLASLINETLADGVYLLSENAIPEAAAALQNAGIDIIAHNNAQHKTREHSQNYFPSPVSYKLDINACPIKRTPQTQVYPDNRLLTEKFHAILEKMSIGRVVHDELSARIDRRLVLCEAQLKEADIRFEKIEARHLDYTGKLNIAKQAIAQQSPVEISMPVSADKQADRSAARGSLYQNTEKEKSFYGIPKTIEKENGELFLIVVPAGKDEVIRIPLAKISLLRRIKKSIFET